MKQHCKHSKEDLVLHFYDESDESTADQVAARMMICPSCREFYASLSTMESLIPRTPSIEPGTDVLSAIRNASSARIREAAADSQIPTVSRGWGTNWSIYRRLAVAGMAALAMFMVGRLTAPATNASLGLGLDNVPASISSVQYDENSGVVQIHYTTEASGVISGSIDDAQIRSMLELALADGSNPSARLRTAKMLTQMKFDPVVPNSELVDALGQILTDESNVGMKLQAVKALRRVHGGQALPELLSETLLELMDTSTNSALRMEILELLTESELARQELGRILGRAASDENSFIRHRAMNALNQMDGVVRLEELK